MILYLTVEFPCGETETQSWRLYGDKRNYHKAVREALRKSCADILTCGEGECWGDVIDARKARPMMRARRPLHTEEA